MDWLFRTIDENPVMLVLIGITLFAMVMAASEIL